MTKRKLVFGAVAALLSLGLTAAGLLAVDLFLHYRAERSAGLNRWGYRGPVAGSKAPGEIRIVMLGGSTVFGYGGPSHESAPALLEQELQARHPGRPIRVINLGFNNEGAHAFLPTLEDYASLDYDIACLYEGYNDIAGDDAPNTAVFRHESPVFRLTGYFPILPLVLNEKALALRHGGDLRAAYEPGADGKAVFTPGVASRVSATALETASAISDAVSRQVARVADAPAVAPATGAADGCATPWSAYCGSVARAVRFARARGVRVLVAAQPLMVDPAVRRAQASQQAAVSGMLRRQFPGDAGVLYANVGETIDLADRNLTFDGMHLGLDGNRALARAFVAPVEQLIGAGTAR